MPGCGSGWAPTTCGRRWPTRPARSACWRWATAPPGAARRRPGTSIPPRVPSTPTSPGRWRPATPRPWRLWTRRTGSGCWPPGGRGGGGGGRARAGGPGGSGPAGRAAAAGRRGAGVAGGRRGPGRAAAAGPPAVRRGALRGRVPGGRLVDPMTGAPPVVAVVGPTATGKTALAVALAHRLAELGGAGGVVNADSMQLSGGMDIGPAKPTPAERDGVPHHVLDLWHVREPASVAEYRQRARAAVDRLRASGVVPLLVGGSGLYVRAVLDELDFPGTDPAVRARLAGELATAGPAALHDRLAVLDPGAAAAILPSNGRRVVRALEVIELTGGPFTARLPEPRAHYPAVSIGLDRAAGELDERVARRVDAMW